MDASGFQAGDVVYLNSGSPPLTISRVYDPEVEVVWIDEVGSAGQLRAPAMCFTDQDPTYATPVESRNR